MRLARFSSAGFGRRACLVGFAVAGAVAGSERVPPIPEGDFSRLHELIKPQNGESPWREINWLTDVTAARRRASEEGKPLIIFTAADGSPLGRT
jgi:hypothetical protein